MWICRDQDALSGSFLHRLRFPESNLIVRPMSVLDDFERIRLYRERASEFESLAETEAFPDVRLRFRIIARHYRELMDRELHADKARMTELIERARHQRQQVAAKEPCQRQLTLVLPDSGRTNL
jgi:hypothetical protein